MDNNQNGKTVLSGSMKLIPISQIPPRKPNQILIAKIKSIPAGTALVITEADLAELGMPSFTAVRAAVPRYARSNLIPRAFKAVQRKTNGQTSIYIADQSTNNSET